MNATQQSDLVHDSKLETRFLEDCVCHVYEDSDRVTSQRAVVRHEYWKRKRHLGSGGFGIVWLESCTKGTQKGEERAVKEIKRTRETLDYHRELEAIAKFSHRKYARWFAKSFGWYEQADAFYLTMEYFPLGDLHSYLINVSQPLPEREAQHVVFQLLEGLQYMHSNGFVHRDIKPANILLQACPPHQEEWWVKISDFGISKRIRNNTDQTSNLPGVMAFTPPERHGFTVQGVQNGSYSPFGDDIWAIGALAHQLLTKRHAFGHWYALNEYVDNSNQFPSEHLDKELLSSDANHFVRTLMHADPRYRPPVGQALRTDWMISVASIPPVPFQEIGVSTDENRILPLSRAQSIAESCKSSAKVPSLSDDGPSPALSSKLHANHRPELSTFSWRVEEDRHHQSRKKDPIISTKQASSSAPDTPPRFSEAPVTNASSTAPSRERSQREMSERLNTPTRASLEPTTHTVKREVAHVASSTNSQPDEIHSNPVATIMYPRNLKPRSRPSGSKQPRTDLNVRDPHQIPYSYDAQTEQRHFRTNFIAAAHITSPDPRDANRRDRETRPGQVLSHSGVYSPPPEIENAPSRDRVNQGERALELRGPLDTDPLRRNHNEALRKESRKKPFTLQLPQYSYDYKFSWNGRSLAMLVQFHVLNFCLVDELGTGNAKSYITNLDIDDGILTWTYNENYIAWLEKNQESRICVWDIQRRKFARLIENPFLRIRYLHFIPHTNELIGCWYTREEGVKLIKYQPPDWTPELLHTIPPHPGTDPKRLFVVPNAKYFVLMFVEKVEKETPKTTRPYRRAIDRVKSALSSPRTRDKDLKVFTYPEMSLYAELRLPGSSWAGAYATFSPNSQLLALDDREAIVLWNVTSKSAVMKWAPYDGSKSAVRTTDLVFSNDSEVLGYGYHYARDDPHMIFTLYEWGLGIRYHITRSSDRLSWAFFERYRRDERIRPSKFLQDGSLVSVVVGGGRRPLCETISAKDFQSIRALGRRYPETKEKVISHGLHVTISRDFGLPLEEEPELK